MKPSKVWLVIILLSSSIVLSFAFPRAKYVGTDFISNMEIPEKLSDWRGRDVKDELNINLGGEEYLFLSNLVAYKYINRHGKKLLFIILDAGNFHHPKVCFTAEGFKIKDLKDIKLNIAGREFKAHTLYTERGTESFLSLYWISIDKKIAHEWIKQKLRQLYFSLFNKKRVGLMIRIDIPAREDNVDDALTLAKQFINDLGQAIQPEQADFIFGEKPSENYNRES